MRRGRIIGGIVLLLAATALSAPYAFAAEGSAVDQGYPCATTPPAAPGSNGSPGATNGSPGATNGTEQCGTTTPPVVTPAPAPPVVSAPAPAPAAAAAPTQNVAGATHTVHRTATPTAAAVAPAQSGTLPFTGVQLGVFVVVGLLLIGGGLVLRASGRTGSNV